MPFYGLLLNVGWVPDGLTNFMWCSPRRKRGRCRGRAGSDPRRWCCRRTFIGPARETRAIAEGIRAKRRAQRLAQSVAVGGVCIVYRFGVGVLRDEGGGAGAVGLLEVAGATGGGAAAAKAITGSTIGELRFGRAKVGAKVGKLRSDR